MWTRHFTSVGASVLKRAVDDNEDTPDTPRIPSYNLPPLTWGLIALITLIFVPAFLLSSYAFQNVYTTLAIVENPNPAAYEAVASDENDDAPAAVPGPDDAAADEEAAAVASSPKPFTASIRRTYKLLRSVNGWRGHFRGFALAFVIVILSSIGSVILAAIPFLPPLVAGLIVMLALVQLNTAWVHIVIRANPSSTSVWRGLPAFRRTFEATSIPTFFLWLSNTIVTVVSLFLARALKVEFPHDVPTYSDATWKALIVVLVAIVLVFLLVIPANVILVRVQASLLSPEQDTVVPFDRSFNGTVEPAVVGGRTFVTIRDAYRTFSRASWKRVSLLYVKVYLVAIAIDLIYAAAIIPVIVLTSKKVTPDN